MENITIIQDLLHFDEAEIDENEDTAPEQEAAAIETQIADEKIQPVIRLDYKLTTCQERADLVNKIVAQTPKENLTARYLEILGDYIMGGITKQEKKDHLYLTDNRRITIDRRETSFEGLAEKFENGEDGIYSIMAESDKNVIFQHKQEITEEDIKEVPGLKELREQMAQVEEAGKSAIGKKKYLLKKQLIEMRRDQYVLKNAYRAPINVVPSLNRGVNKISLEEHRSVDKNGNPKSDGLISLMNPDHVAAILANYNGLKIETAGRYWDDFYYLMEDFDQLMKKALDPYPAYHDIVRYKMAGKTNVEIQAMLLSKHNIEHSIQYISQLWCSKIPKIIANKEQEDYLIWYYETQKNGPMKKCSCCQQLKPANSRFFSRNRTSKDGWYSLCKSCRNAKNKKN